MPAARPSSTDFPSLHRLEGAKATSAQQVEGHHSDRDNRKGGRERNVVRDADIAVDDIADEA